MSQYNKSIRAKLFNYFQGRLKLKLSTRGWYRCDCVFCGKHHSMGINLGTSKVHCFACNEYVTPIGLLMRMENFTLINQVYNFIHIQQEYKAYEDFVARKLVLKEVQLPESFRLITDVDDYLGRCAQNYLKNIRGYKLSYLESKGVGYCVSGRYRGYIIFPCYQNGKLIFFQGRQFVNIGPKMQNPELEEFGIGKTQVIYNADAFFIYNYPYVAESVTNALTMGEKGTATFGKAISQWQMSYIIGSPCKGISLLLDSDAYVQALHFGMQIVPYKKVRVIKMPKDQDVNDLGKKETYKLIKKTPWQTYSDLLKLKLNEKGTQYTYNRNPTGRMPQRGYN